MSIKDLFYVESKQVPYYMVPMNTYFTFDVLPSVYSKVIRKTIEVDSADQYELIVSDGGQRYVIMGKSLVSSVDLFEKDASGHFRII